MLCPGPVHSKLQRFKAASSCCESQRSLVPPWDMGAEITTGATVPSMFSHTVKKCMKHLYCPCRSTSWVFWMGFGHISAATALSRDPNSKGKKSTRIYINIKPLQISKDSASHFSKAKFSMPLHSHGGIRLHSYTSVVPLQIKPQSRTWFSCATFVQLSSLSQTAGCRGRAVVPRGSDHHEGLRKLNALQTETSGWL